VKKGKGAVSEADRVRILLLSNSGKRNYEILEMLCVNQNTVLGVKKRCLRGGIASTLHRAKKSKQPIKYGNRETAEIIALAS